MTGNESRSVAEADSERAVESAVSTVVADCCADRAYSVYEMTSTQHIPIRCSFGCNRHVRDGAGAESDQVRIVACALEDSEGARSQSVPVLSVSR